MIDEGDDECHELAEKLSSNFLNTEPYDSTSSTLEDYLSHHGVLVTMCMLSLTSCFLNVGISENHISASWINAALGIHVIPSRSQMGLILKPDTSSDLIKCIYPTDAGTNGRDNAGCGPMTYDPVYGSERAAKLGPLTRWAYRRNVNEYKEFNFPGTDYADMDCSDFLDPFTSPQGIVVWQQQTTTSSCDTTLSNTEEGCREETDDGNTDKFIFDTLYTLAKAQAESYMGHPVCKWNDGPPPAAVDSPDAFLLDLRPVPFEPEDWASVMALQETIMAQAPAPLIWNEIVLELPTHLKDVVEAVVYYETTPGDAKTVHGRAKKQAEKLGGVPVLRVNSMDPSVDDPLLVCAQDPHYSHGSAILEKDDGVTARKERQPRSPGHGSDLSPRRRSRVLLERPVHQGIPMLLRQGGAAMFGGL